MNDLVKSLVEGLIDVNESTNRKIVGMFGGGFKPPTAGHLEVVKRALEENPELDELIILVGSGTRDSISQEESLAIWNMYKKYLPGKITVIASPKDKPPIGAIYSYARKNPDEIIYWFIGAREGNEEDFQDIEKRTRSLRKLAYQNVKVKEIVTGGTVSGTKARRALLNQDKEAFLQFLPDIPEVDAIWDMLKDVVQERVSFNADFISQDDVEFVDDMADRKLAPIDIDLSGNHFFDRLNDPRNLPDISIDELEEFFDKLADEKEAFIEFLRKYKDVVVKDTESNLNIPFMKLANKAIAKTIMRKKDFKTPNVVLPLDEGRYDNETKMQSRYIVNLFKAEFGNKFKDLKAGEGNVGGKKYTLQLGFVPKALTSGADFEIDGFAQPKIVAINIIYNPEAFPEAYNELIAGIKDAVRHELEHFGQFHFDKDADIDVPEEGYPSRFEYLVDDYETAAHVQGLYKRAKTKKVPFTDVLDDFLDDELDILSPEEIELVRNQYLWYAKNNLPAVQLNEIQWNGSPSYSFSRNGDSYSFTNDGGDNLDLNFAVESNNKGTFAHAQFSTLSLPNLGLSNAIKTTNTIGHITTDLVNRHNIDRIDFETQAYRLYKNAIPHYFPDATVKGNKRGASLYITENLLTEKDPKKGTGKKPKGSGRRLYTDENPKDTVKIKFSTRQDIVDTLGKTSFKNKSHARQSQVINLIHQRVRAAYNRAKKPEVKKRLKTALDYITKRKEASKEKTKRLQAQKKKKKANENVAPNHNQKAAPYGSGYKKMEEGDTYEKMAAKGKKSGNLKQGTVRKRLNIPKGEKVPMYKIDKEISRLKKMDKDKNKKGVQLGDKNQKYYKALQLAKTLKSTTNLKESLNQELTPQIASLTQYMSDNGLNLQPYPKIKFIDNDVENASDLLGRTAYYDPNQQLVALYTMGRHPKDILRSYAHELIHHHQNLSGTLDHSNTTNTNEDGALEKIEREAYEEGNILFRNWEDSIKNDN